MSELISLAVADRIATVTLQRAPVNAFNAEMFKAFHAILDGLKGRSDWAVLHIRSTLKVFSGGADLAEISTRFSAPDKMDAAAKVTRPFQELFQRISDLPQVSLAEIGGAAMGGGYELALGCDLRIAANEARIGLPEVGLGLLPGGGGTQRLTWIAGPAVAARIILAADIVDGRQARELGMVQWAVPRADLEAEARKLAQKVAGLPSPLARRLQGVPARGQRPRAQRLRRRDRLDRPPAGHRGDAASRRRLPGRRQALGRFSCRHQMSRA